MGLQINLHAKLKEYFGFDHFKGNQEAIIKNAWHPPDFSSEQSAEK